MTKLKEIASQLGYLKENLPISLQQLEKEIKNMTGEYGSISERKPGIYRIKFPSMRREFEDKEWNEILKYIEEHPNDYKVIDSNNYYEKNWEPEEPPEAVPIIYFK